MNFRKQKTLWETKSPAPGPAFPVPVEASLLGSKEMLSYSDCRKMASYHSHNCPLKLTQVTLCRIKEDSISHMCNWLTSVRTGTVELGFPTRISPHPALSITYSVQANKLCDSWWLRFSLWQCPLFPSSNLGCFCSLKTPPSRDQLKVGVWTTGRTRESGVWEALEFLCLERHGFSSSLSIPTLNSCLWKLGRH